jgi:hypothetical protein
MQFAFISGHFVVLPRGPAIAKEPTMTRILALLALVLLSIPQLAQAQSESVSASAYVQTEAPLPVSPDASASELEFAMNERLARTEAAAASAEWREASRALREAQHINRHDRRVRLAQLGLRNRLVPSLVLQLDPMVQEELLHHDDTASAFTTAGHVFGVIGAASAVAGGVVVILGALGLAFVRGLEAIAGRPASGNLDGLAPLVGILGGAGLGFAAIGGGFHLAASGEGRAIRAVLVPQVSAEGGGILVGGSF